MQRLDVFSNSLERLQDVDKPKSCTEDNVGPVLEPPHVISTSLGTQHTQLTTSSTAPKRRTTTAACSPISTTSLA